MEKQVTKNQHIVPQRHLRKFSLTSDKNKLKAFDCDLIKILNKDQSIISVCSGHFHYALEPGTEDKYSQAVEDAFGNLETWYGDNIERIEKSLLSQEKLSDSDRFGLSCVIANFFFRGQNFRRESLSALKELVDWMQPTVSEHIFSGVSKKYPDIFTDKKKGKEIADKVTQNELQKVAGKTSHATQRAFDVGHANTLTRKKWDIFLNKTEYPFITSDEAVIDLMDPRIPENYMLRGAWLLKTQIFNLSPKVSISLTFPFTEDLRGKVEYREMNNKGDIFRHNLFYVNFSHKYAYAPNTDFFKDLIAFEDKK
ncbi:MAG: hypothetical protein A2589_02665 [Candidatus Vogelbacteria bacterium RIFOXYD1_FULL_46_19]|uniref:DUF4238 domain-containing protein n=1 Tax=Candidatus Vogelbacteria bacterium RIFOXYD1_FULL_46_19 TaxID=1802439 RepID=A0A1G2QH48_9BACT|nr:MAG: hypothetical protein A2589_02665 [Candidatus Vogelbacteria bacterium RIFOXYD1_FULL_46_19]